MCVYGQGVEGGAKENSGEETGQANSRGSCRHHRTRSRLSPGGLRWVFIHQFPSIRPSVIG